MPTDIVQQYAQRIDALINSHFPGGQIAANIADVAQARAFLKGCDIAKKDLQLVKKELALSKKEEKLGYTGDRANIQSSTARSSLFGKTLGGIMRKSNQNKRANTRQNELARMSQFDNLSALVDRTVVSIERAKLQVQQWVAQQK